MALFSRKQELVPQPEARQQAAKIAESQDSVKQYSNKVTRLLENPALVEKISPQEIDQIKTAVENAVRKGASDEEVRRLVATASPEAAAQMESYDQATKKEIEPAGEVSLKESGIAFALEKGKSPQEIARPFIEEGMYEHDLGQIFINRQIELTKWPQDNEDHTGWNPARIKEREQEIHNLKKEALLNQWSQGFKGVIETAAKIPDQNQARVFVENAVKQQFEKFRPRYEKEQQQAQFAAEQKAKNLAA